MAKLTVYNMEGQAVDNIEVSDNIFGVDVEKYKHLMHSAVVANLANKRQGTQSAKTRSEVRGGGRKPWRQKGTGHARQGSIRSPQWKGGGVVFAPKPRDYSVKINKKERRLAIFAALSEKVLSEKVVVLDKIEFAAPKTKEFVKVMDNLKVEKGLVVVKEPSENAILSARNLQKVKLINVDSINVFDLLRYEKLVLTVDTVKRLEEVYE